MIEAGHSPASTETLPLNLCEIYKVKEPKQERSLRSMMKRIFYIITIFALTVNATALAAKRYTIDAVRIHAAIDSTGGVWINESRTYTFKGRYSFATYELQLQGIPEISHIEVSESGAKYAEVNSEGDGRPGTFFIERKQNTLFMRWNYEARDETRTFDLRFYLRGVAVAHADVAEFYYKFIGTGWDRGTASVEVTAQLPGAVPVEDIKVWAHGPLHGTCAITGPGQARFNVAPLPAKTFWEGRIVFPKEFLPAAFSRTQRTVLPTILAEERAWAEEANRTRADAARKFEAQQAWQEQNLPWLIAANLGGVLLIFYLYNRHGRSLVEAHRRLEMSPPQDMPPALANYYYTGSQLSAGALVATLLDLARRGIITIREESHEKGFLGWHWTKQEYVIHFETDRINDNRSKLLAHELELLRFLQNDIAQGAARIPFSAIPKSRGKFMKWFQQWRKGIKAMVADQPYFDPESVRAALRGSLAMLALIGLGILAVVKMGKTGIPFIISGVALAALSFVILRYSKETAAQRGRLLGFRDFIKRVSKNQDGGNFSLQTLEPALIYAMAVDFPSHALKKLLQNVEQYLGTVNYPWYVSQHRAHGNFAEAMSGMMTAASTTLSSASGAGGGASSGGGGGAGGSGGSAG